MNATSDKFVAHGYAYIEDVAPPEEPSAGQKLALPLSEQTSRLTWIFFAMFTHSTSGVRSALPPTIILWLCVMRVQCEPATFGRQRWYYYPGMTPDDVLVIKSFDSEGVIGNTCPHASFAHPNP